jgi:CRP/FNR family transcriptional regulator, anaerobic regulatory protein
MFATVEAAPLQPDLAPAPDNDNADTIVGLRTRLSTPLKLAPDTTLFAQGDAATYLFQVVKGVLRLCRLMSDGRRSVIGFAFPGDVIGLALRDVYVYSAESVTGCELSRYAGSAVGEMMERSPAFARQMFARLSAELCAAQDQMLLLGRKTASERVASFLLTLGNRQAGEDEAPKTVELPMSRPDIADYLGLTTETVCRILTKLKVAGVLSLPSSGRVKLLDLEALRSLAEDSESLGASAARESKAAARLLA